MVSVVWACETCSANNNNSRTYCWRCDQEIRKEEKARLEKIPAGGTEKKIVTTEKTLAAVTEMTQAAGTMRTLAGGTVKTLAAGTVRILVAGVEKSQTAGPDKQVIGTKKTLSAGTEKTLSDGIEKAKTDGTEKTLAVGTNKTLADGTDKTPADGTEKVLADCTEMQIATIQPFSPGTDKNEVRIVLIGKTGVGKSSTANTILGQEAFKAEASPIAVTEKCHFERSERFGKRILLVDTPGFFDTSTTKDVIDNEIKKCIGISAPGPHAFLLVMSFTNRFTEEERKVLEEVSNMFGEQMNKYLIVLFTGKDQIDKGFLIEDHVEKYPEEFRRLFQNAGGSYITFNNKGSDSEKEHDVEALLDRIDQMVKKNGGSHFTSKMFEAAEGIIQQRIAKELAAKKEEIQRSVEEEIRTAVETEMKTDFDAERTGLKQICEEDIKQYKILRLELSKERLNYTTKTKGQNLRQSLRPLVLSKMITKAERKIIRQREECEGPEKAEVHRQLATAGQEIQQLLQKRKEMAETETPHDDEEDDPEVDVFQLRANVATDVYREQIRNDERINIEKETGIFQSIKKKMKGLICQVLDLFRKDV